MTTVALLSSLTSIYFIFIFHINISQESNFFRVPHPACCKGDTPQFPTAGELVVQLGREVRSSVHQTGVWFLLANEMGTQWIMSIQAEILKDIAIIQHCFPLFLPCYLRNALQPLELNDSWCSRGMLLY